MRCGFTIVVAALSWFPDFAFAQPSRATALVEDQASYLVRCRRETIAGFPNARTQADTICRSRWEEIIAAGPIADAIFAVAPAPGATFDSANARAKAGRLRDISVEVTRPPSPGIALRWGSSGEPIPFNLEEAMRVRGARLSMIACQSFGISEGTHIYSVNAPGKAAFALTIAFLNAAVASQSSSFTAKADFSGQTPSLAAMRRDGSEWTPQCPP